mmetsp:Transcript_10983/g.50738  ORF Transcript_10983/g.50738 Transcript_10983/m.50738 type:complete len:211 (+) Transcript_10983:9170-9802(+)
MRTASHRISSHAASAQQPLSSRECQAALWSALARREKPALCSWMPLSISSTTQDLKYCSGMVIGQRWWTCGPNMASPQEARKLSRSSSRSAKTANLCAPSVLLLFRPPSLTISRFVEPRSSLAQPRGCRRLLAWSAMRLRLRALHPGMRRSASAWDTSPWRACPRLSLPGSFPSTFTPALLEALPAFPSTSVLRFSAFRQTPAYRLVGPW